MTNLDQILQSIKAERDRQHELPGSEWDSKNSPGDWVAMIGHYVNEEVRRNGINPKANDFENSLIKSAAVILAAIEHIPVMKERNELN